MRKKHKRLKCLYLKILFFLRYKLIHTKMAGGYLTCPNCGRVSVCPCESCRNQRRVYNVTKFKEFEWIDGEFVKCPYCGFKEHIDYWTFDSCMADRIYI